MKKLLFVAILFLCSVVVVNAEDSNVYFTSNNGVELTQKEYNLFVELYGEDIIADLTQEKYDTVNVLDINNSEIDTEIYEDVFNQYANPGISLYASYVETTYKRIAISKSCKSSGACAVVLTMRWKFSPAVRSWDHMGVRYTGSISLDNTSIVTHLEYSNYYIYSANYKVRSNGIACAFDLDDNVNLLSVTQSFGVTGNGSIFGSYQHATQNLSYSDSQNYAFSYAGYGHVFDFYGTAYGKYDGMNGVDVTI